MAKRNAPKPSGIELERTWHVNVESPRPEAESSGIEAAAEAVRDVFNRAGQAAHEAVVTLSGNVVENDPLILVDAQGRERMATIRENANRVNRQMLQTLRPLIVSFLMAVGITGTTTVYQFDAEFRRGIDAAYDDAEKAVKEVARDAPPEVAKKILEVIREGRRIAREVDQVTEPDQVQPTERAIPKRLAKK